MAEIRVEYRCPFKNYTLTAYVDEETGVGWDEYTDQSVKLRWNGDEWVDDCG